MIANHFSQLTYLEIRKRNANVEANSIGEGAAYSIITKTRRHLESLDMSSGVNQRRVRKWSLGLLQKTANKAVAVAHRCALIDASIIDSNVLCHVTPILSKGSPANQAKAVGAISGSLFKSIFDSADYVLTFCYPPMFWLLNIVLS